MYLLSFKPIHSPKHFFKINVDSLSDLQNSVFLNLATVLGGLHAMVTRGKGILPYMANTGMCRWTEHCQRTESRHTILDTNEPLLKGI